MVYRYPDFYYLFQCRAGDCRHTCCRGWEINIDYETTFNYRHLPEGEREEVCSHLKFDEWGAQMILTEDEACPFLREDGLCEMIVRHGEDYISDICHEHPRFYNDFENTSEMGLGLSCEEVVSLLLDREKEYSIIEEIDESESYPVYDPKQELADRFRSRAEEILADREHLWEVLYDLLGDYSTSGDIPPVQAMASTYLQLEIMDPKWAVLLRELLLQGPELSALQHQMDRPGYRRIFRYLLYRNAPLAEDRRGQFEILKVLVSGMYLIAALERNGTDLHEAVRLYSAEIEYSDCAIDQLRQLL